VEWLDQVGQFWCCSTFFAIFNLIIFSNCFNKEGKKFYITTFIIVVSIILIAINFVDITGLKFWTSNISLLILVLICNSLETLKGMQLKVLMIYWHP